MISRNIHIAFLVLLIVSTFEIASSETDSNPCHPKYASQTKTTKECICLSRNCEGPKCQSGQGFVWYNYLQCPTCSCLSPKANVKLVDHVESAASDGDHKTELMKPEQPQIKNTQERQPSSINDEKEEEETWREWFIDNVNTIFASFTGMVVVVIIALYLFMSVGDAVKSQDGLDKVKEKSNDANKKVASKNALTFTKAGETHDIKDAKIS